MSCRLCWWLMSPWSWFETWTWTWTSVGQSSWFWCSPKSDYYYYLSCLSCQMGCHVRHQLPMSTWCGICREETAWSSEQTTSWVEARRAGVLCVTRFTARLATESPKQAGRGRNLRQPEVVCISGEKPSLKGEHWCQESWMAKDRSRPPLSSQEHDRSREVPTCPKRSRQVPTGPGQPCQSCQASSESPIDSPLNSSPCPDANSVKFCQVPTPILSSSVRSRRKFCQILSG